MSNEWKKILIVLVTTVFSLAIHAMMPPTVPITPDVLSWVANKLTFVGTVTLFFLVTYYVIATVFLSYQQGLPGGRLCRGLLFGVLVGGIWWVGMIESIFVFGTELLGEFLIGLLDFLPIMLLCLLLAIFIVKNRDSKGTYPEPRRVLRDAVVFILVFLVGRSIRYFVISDYSTDTLLPLLLWTAAFAGMISLNFSFLNIRNSSPHKTIANFTLVVFGLHYALFVYFIPLIFKDMFWGLTMVYLFDLLLVYAAGWIAMKFTPVNLNMGSTTWEN